MSEFSNLKTYMSQQGLPINDDIIIDGTINRYDSRGNGKKSEWYVGHCFEGNKYIVTFGSWLNVEATYTYRSYAKGELKDEDILIQHTIEEINIQKEKVQKEREKAFLKMWDNAEACAEHPYMAKKKIVDLNLKKFQANESELLIVPLFNLQGDLKSCIKINERGDKRYFFGISTKMLYNVQGEISKTNEVIFCEGYSTGNAIFQSTGIPTISCGGWANIICTAYAFKQANPNKILMLAADNDPMGLKIVPEWKKFISTQVYIPPNEGEDFNDLFVRQGISDVKNIFVKRLRSNNSKKMFEMKIKPIEFWNKITAKESINIIYAKAKTGKTRFTYEMMFCLNNGINFLDLKTSEKKPSILYIDGELSDSDIISRMEDVHSRYAKLYPNLDVDMENFGYLRYKDFKETLDEKINLNSQKQQKALHEDIMEHDIIVIDSYGCCTEMTEGDSFKIDIKDWKNFFNWLRGYREQGKTFIVLMHSTKSGVLAGTQVIKNDVDSVYRLNRSENIDPRALIHFEFLYEDCRVLSQNDQQPFEAKLCPNEKWTFNKKGEF